MLPDLSQKLHNEKNICGEEKTKERETDGELDRVQARNNRKERKNVEGEEDARRDRDITNKCSEVKRGVKKVTSMERRGRRE